MNILVQWQIGRRDRASIGKRIRSLSSEALGINVVLMFAILAIAETYYRNTPAVDGVTYIGGPVSWFGFILLARALYKADPFFLAYKKYYTVKPPEIPFLSITDAGIERGVPGFFQFRIDWNLVAGYRESKSCFVLQMDIVQSVIEKDELKDEAMIVELREFLKARVSRSVQSKEALRPLEGDALPLQRIGAGESGPNSICIEWQLAPPSRNPLIKYLLPLLAYKFGACIFLLWLGVVAVELYHHQSHAFWPFTLVGSAVFIHSFLKASFWLQRYGNRLCPMHGCNPFVSLSDFGLECGVRGLWCERYSWDLLTGFKENPSAFTIQSDIKEFRIEQKHIKDSAQAAAIRDVLNLKLAGKAVAGKKA